MLKKLLFLTGGILLMTSTAFAQIVVESQVSTAFGSGVNTVQQTSYTVANIDAGTGTKLVVGFSMEVGSPNFSVTFGGVPLTEIQTSSDATGGSNTGIFILDGASGIADVVVNTGSGGANGAGIFVQALSGAQPGFETSGALGDGQAIFGDLTGTLTGISEDAHIVSMFIDQNQGGEQEVEGLTRTGAFFGGNFNQIGSAVALAATGTGTGSNITVTYNDLGPNNDFNNRANASFVSFAVGGGLLGDVNMDGVVDFLDISPFITILATNGFQLEADIDLNGTVDFLDIGPFVLLLSSTGS